MKPYGLSGLALLLLLGATTAEAAFPEDFVVEPSAPALEDIVPVVAPGDEDKELTRAVFTAMLVNQLYTRAEIDRCFWDIAPSLPPRFTLVFTDVHINDPFALEICMAMRDGLVRGYKDGSFHPNQKINLAEASKIISRSFVLAPYAEIDLTGPWFGPYLYALTVRNAIPDSLSSVRQDLTAGEMQEILERLQKNITWRPARTFEELTRPARAATTQSSQSTVQSSGAASSQSSASSAPAVPPRAPSSSAPSSAPTTSSAASAESTSSERKWWNPF